MSGVSRRELFGLLGVAASGGLISDRGGESLSKAEKIEKAEWKYVPLAPIVVADAAYRLIPEGGCMYGLFSAILTNWSAVSGQSCEAFPLHMMRYGEGGIGLWGSICGTLNGGAAIVGLFERDKSRREQLIAELFSWYESTELPSYEPQVASLKPGPIEKSVAKSVLCHVSVSRWCEVSGCEAFSKEMGERCRRLTASVAGKTVELLNRNQDQSCTVADLHPAVKSCLSCHGKSDLRDTIGKMDCTECHKLPSNHPH
jgi:hypothetical protein